MKERKTKKTKCSIFVHEKENPSSLSDLSRFSEFCFFSQEKKCKNC